MSVSPFPWVFIDLETTGLKPESDKIIEFGLIRRDGQGHRAEWEQLVSPAQALDPFISQITGIDDAMLAGAPPISEVSGEAIRFLDDAVIVAHNATFELNFLERQLQIQIDQGKLIDTIEMAKILYPGLGSYSLRNLVRAFALPMLPSHRAKDDAIALEQIFIFLAAKARRLPRRVLQQIVTVLGGEEKGLAGFFTDLLMGRQPAWLAKAIAEMAPASADAEVETDGNAPQPYGMDEEGLFSQSSPGGTAADESLPASGTAKQEEEKEKRLAQEFWQKGSLTKLLREGGALAQKLDNYQYRAQQEEMMGAVAKAFAGSRYLMVEAPTGVGKSLAYLAPAVCWAKAFGHRVVVATHTIALQEQLFQKEIALLKELLPFSFQCVMLKGRGNYLCLNRWRQVMERGRDLIWGERILLARLAVWQAEGGRGDLDSIHLFGIEREWFSQMASSREVCQGNQCPYYRQCFFQKARIGANTSQIIIINHALLLSGARLGEKVIPKYSYLIIDEAHHLEEDGTKQFTEAFSLLEYEKRLQQLHRRRDVFGRPGFLQYLKEYQQQGVGVLENLSPYLEQMEKQVKSVMKRVNSLQAALQNNSLPDMFRIKPDKPRGTHLQGLLANLDNLLVMADDLKKTVDRLSSMLQGDEGEIFEETWLKRQLVLFNEVKYDTDLLEAFLRGIDSRGAGGEAGGGAGEGKAGPGGDRQFGGGSPAGAGEGGPFTREPDSQSYEPPWIDAAEDQVYWAARDLRQKDISLYITPLRIADYFKKYLFAGKASIVFTSATLSVNDGFSYCSQQLGINPDILDTKMLNSPFDHARQVLLLSDKDLPDPARTSESVYDLALADSLQTLLGACGGRSMVLFTSHRQLKAMYDAMAQPLRMLGLELFADGLNGNRSTLLEELRTNEKAVVFGANTYWEGVDLPGLSLTSLLIVRLPFAPPGQPLVEAKMEKLEAEGKDPFYHYSLPHAVLRFKQGYGRLIRTSEDWGVVVVLDNRIVNKSYGQVFQQSLPGGRCLSAPPKMLAEKITRWQREKMGKG